MTLVLTLYLRIHSIRVLHHSVHSWSESAANWNTLLVVCRLNLNLSLSLSCKKHIKENFINRLPSTVSEEETCKICRWTNSLIYQFNVRTFNNKLSISFHTIYFDQKAYLDKCFNLLHTWQWNNSFWNLRLLNKTFLLFHYRVFSD